MTLSIYLPVCSALLCSALSAAPAPGVQGAAQRGGRVRHHRARRRAQLIAVLRAAAAAAAAAAGLQAAGDVLRRLFLRVLRPPHLLVRFALAPLLRIGCRSSGISVNLCARSRQLLLLRGKLILRQLRVCGSKPSMIVSSLHHTSRIASRGANRAPKTDNQIQTGYLSLITVDYSTAPAPKKTQGERKRSPHTCTTHAHRVL